MSFKVIPMNYRRFARSNLSTSFGKTGTQPFSSCRNCAYRHFRHRAQGQLGRRPLCLAVSQLGQNRSQNDNSTPALPRLGKPSRFALGIGLLFAAALTLPKPSSASEIRLPDYSQALLSKAPIKALTSRFGANFSEVCRPPCCNEQVAAPTNIEQASRSHADEMPMSDAERLVTAALRNQGASSSSSTSMPLKQDTGIELAGIFGSKKNTESTEDVFMTPAESMQYYEKEFGENPKYQKMFMPAKKAKKVDVMKSQVPDPAAWDHPEFQPVTAWRTDRMKDLTYTQLWFLIKEHKVDRVKFSNDSKTVLVTTKPSAPGGKRTERVALPFDPDFYHHMIEHNVRVEIPDPTSMLDNILFGSMYLVWPILVAVALFMSTINMRFGPQTDEEKLFKGAKLDRLNESQHRLSFKDIAGIDDIKAEVEELVAFLRNPRRFIDLGAKAPSGVLLVGNPGTGKTLLAKAVAGEAGVAFLSVAGTEFDQLYVGVGAARVRDMFRQAREAAPCILFIDEFDGIGKQRSLTAANESANTINSLLTELDGFEDNAGVIVLAATNRPAALDSALTRPGRFDRLIQLPLPSIDGREEILKVHARGKRVAPDLDLKLIARATGGFTGAQLMNVMNTAAIVAVRRSSQTITTDDLLTALENIQNEDYTGGSQTEDEVATPLMRRSIAIYEAGRALIGAITPFYDEISKVVCCPGGHPSGYTHFIPQEEQLESSVITRAYMEAKMTVALAGRCAEVVMLGPAHISTAGATDMEVANIIAREMVYKCGFSRRLGPVALMDSQTGFLRGQDASFISDLGTELTAIAITDIQELIQGAQAKATFGLAANYKPLKALVSALVERENLDGDDVRQILMANGAVWFPDPFLAGFGWDQDGNVAYPGQEKVTEGEDAAGSSSKNGTGAGQPGVHWPPYPYRVRDDMKDVLDHPMDVLERT